MKKLTIGIIIGLMLGISTNAFASIGDTVTAVFSQYVYEVNGETQTGETPVLVYEGVSYLRTTDIGNMLGYDVTYRSDSRTIAFNKGDTEPLVPVTPVEPVEEPVIDPVTGEPTPVTPTEPVDGETAEETPVVEEEPVVEPEPVVVEEPTNAAQCQQIRDRYTLQIFNLSSTHPNPAYVTWQTGILQSQRDTELSAAGC